MRHKMRFLSVLMALALCFSFLSVTAYAQGDDPECSGSYVIPGVADLPEETQPPKETQPKPTQPPKEPQPPVETQPPAQTEPPEPTEVVPGVGFTEDGIAYTRDLQYDDGTHKQFITIETRNGNIFYIVIDYDKPVDEEGEQYHTYFLNQVDEADLLAILEDGSAPECSCTKRCEVGAINTACEICGSNMTECVGVPETKPTEPTIPSTEPDGPSGNGSGSALLLVLLLACGIGGGVYYFTKVKGANKPQTKGNANLDDYDFGDDEDGEYAEFDRYDASQEDSL